MDPQSANNLDPKLKETYDRVMGTSTQPAAGAVPAPVTADAAPAATPAPVTAAAPASVPGADIKGTLVPPQVPQAPNSTAPATPYTADNLSFQAAIQTPLPGPAAQNPVAAIPQQPSSLLKILYIMGGVVFFVVYTIVWIKIFNLPLPF